MARPEKVRLGDLLVNAQLISQVQLESVLAQQQVSGRRLGRLLVENKFISEMQISEALAKQFNIAFIDLKRYNLDPNLVRLLPEDQARRYRSIVLEAHDDVLTVGMADPTDQAAYDEVAHLLKSEIVVVVVTEGQVLESIDRGYRHTDEIGGQLFGRREMSPRGQDSASGTNQVAGASEVSISKQIQALFDIALQVRASDIHIERHDKSYSHRFRIDGMLLSNVELPHNVSEGMLLRLKLMAELDIAEKTLPQVGRFPMRVGEQKVDVRLAVCPLQKGESAVMHLSYQDGARATLDSLGMPEMMTKRLREILSRGRGMVLVAGPGGCGKTTTLNAALAELDAVTKKFISVEDPVEHVLPNLQQIQVNESGGLSFAMAVLAALHQDPDALILNDIPSAEVARYAMHAALDGQMVLSCLQGYDAISTLCQLTELGISRFMAASAVQAVVAQHLLRRICGHCSEAHVTTPQEHAWLEAEGVSVQQLGALKHGKGCVQCHGTGYHGRVAVFEMLEMRRALVEAAAHDSTDHYVQEATKQLQGKRFTAQGLGLVKQGQTSLSEVMRMSNRHPL